MRKPRVRVADIFKADICHKGNDDHQRIIAAFVGELEAVLPEL